MILRLGFGGLALGFVLELALLLLLAGAMGGAAVILWCLATGFVGLLLLRMQGLALVTALSRGDAPRALPAISGALLAFAAIALIIPGLVSDAAGLLLLLPMVRLRVARRILRATPDDRIIEGEFREPDAE